MRQDQAIGAIWLTGALVLVGSALIARRMPSRRLVRLALIWIAILLGATLGARLIERP